MNAELYSDWYKKRTAAMNYKMETIRNRRKKRTNLMLKIVVPSSITFITVGAFTFAQFFALAYTICCFIIAVGISILICLDDKDNKKFIKILESWGDTFNADYLPPSIKDTFN